MNSIDAIIALCVLTAGFALLIGTVNETRKNSESAIDTINAKATALDCAGIIDSIITNSANTYLGELNCGAEGEKITATQNGKTKTAQIIGKAKKEAGLEVEIKKHYLD